MSTENNKLLARRLYDEVLNQQNDAPLAELAAPGYVEHDPLPGQGEGLAGLADRFRMLTSAFAPRFEIEDMVAEGDRVVVRWTNTGTHVGDFAGIPPTGRSFQIAGIDIYRVEANQVAEHWHVVDELRMLQQLGIIPTFDQTPA
ncbi:ester cyclase [Kribbella jejuensis]|uniref:Steroid delta-isomerase-like uncharacterized protein n=1 Tax=Kribbella jejuensis TaxID=236068 RepID=A0A542D9N3_9ACTN|nr:ester cyclase [Kribbella jejuensis]TQI99778.1 steroid delta-isomerase-like uncharacterized protein [Kribbella jejuensis]